MRIAGGWFSGLFHFILGSLLELAGWILAERAVEARVDDQPAILHVGYADFRLAHESLRFGIDFDAWRLAVELDRRGGYAGLSVVAQMELERHVALRSIHL